MIPRAAIYRRSRLLAACAAMSVLAGCPLGNDFDGYERVAGADSGPDGAPGGSGGSAVDSGLPHCAVHGTIGPCKTTLSDGFCGPSACTAGRVCGSCEECEGEPPFEFLINVVELTSENSKRYWCGDPA